MRRQAGIEARGSCGHARSDGHCLFIMLIGQKRRAHRSISSASTRNTPAPFKLGAVTNTQDAEGEVLETAPGAAAHRGAVCARRFRVSSGPVPAAADVFRHQDRGVPLYKKPAKARRWNANPALSGDEFELTRFAPPELDFRVRCSKGTYCPSRWRTISARSSGCGAHLSALRRTAIDKFARRAGRSPCRDRGAAAVDWRKDCCDPRDVDAQFHAVEIRRNNSPGLDRSRCMTGRCI